MPPRSAWILAFGLALLCPATQASSLSCRDDSCGNGKARDRDALSIQLQPPAQARGQSYDARWSEVGTLPPGLRERDELPPGLRERDELPPGLRKDFDGRAHEWRGRVAANVRIRNSGASVSPIPEPSGFLLFSIGLLVAGAAGRRRLRA
jgi:hypothetical protein